VFEVKLDSSKLSQKSLDHLVKLFLEAKWYYNYVLSHKNIDDAETKIKQVPVKVQDEYETRNLEVLTAQMRQDIKARTFGSLKSLKTLKTNGYRIGRLKFKTRVNSVPLRQVGRTFDFHLDRSVVKIQGLKKWLRARGLKQIPEDAEIANATLVRKPSGFYLHITTYQDKQQQKIPEESIGIDFGCETQLTFSNGTKVEFQVPPPERLKKLDRKIMRKQFNGKQRSRSKKKYQDQWNRRKEYERLNNRKRDIRNKLVSTITSRFKYVCFQDESIHAWHAGNHGKKVQNSGIGGIISDLKHKSHTPLEVSKFFPSTQLCPVCSKKNKIPEWIRVYECDCGYREDRDIKSALCIEREGLKDIPVGHRDFKARERTSSIFFDRLSKINCVKVNKMTSMN